MMSPDDLSAKRRRATTGTVVPPPPPSAAAWETCYVTPIEVEAHVVRGFLEQYGVPCVIRKDRFSVQPLTFCAFGNVEILVPSDWINVARGLIAGRASQPRAARGQLVVLRPHEGSQDA